MVLADTSVWIQHFRWGQPLLADNLVNGQVMMHPFVAGELASGNFKNREAILSNLLTLPQAILASNAEVLQAIERRQLWGRGLGWVDLHLLVSAILTNCAFWTLDKRLAHAGKELGLARAL